MGIKGGADTVHGGSGQVFVTTGFGVCDVAGVESCLDTDKRLAGFEVSAEARDNGLEYGFRGDTLRCAAGKLARCGSWPGVHLGVALAGTLGQGLLDQSRDAHGGELGSAPLG